MNAPRTIARSTTMNHKDHKDHKDHKEEDLLGELRGLCGFRRSAPSGSTHFVGILGGSCRH
jgi:hypothetical protein